MRSQFIKTPDGVFTAFFSEKGLARLDFPNGRSVRRPRPAIAQSITRQWRLATERAIKQVLAGRKPNMPLPLDLSSGTAFQRAVWNALRKIPAGNVRTYGEIARSIGRPKAVRAVGQACGANPIPLLVPCPRVLAADGRIGGFSAGWEWKRKLLGREGSL